MALLLLAGLCSAQSGSWTSVAYVDGGVCQQWGGAEGTPCEDTHYFTSFQEQGGTLDLEFMDFSPQGSCETTGIAFTLMGAFAGEVDHASYFLDVDLNGQFVASVPLNPSSYTSDSCELLEQIAIDAVAINSTSYHSSGVNSITISPSELDVAAARFCAVEVTGQYHCTTPSCRVCDEEGECLVSDQPGCCSSNEDCAEDLEGSITQNCLLPHCDGPTNQCMSVWICTDPSVADLQPCNTVQDCQDVASYCSNVQCEETCVTEAIIPLQPGCCNVASDCTPAVCAVAACDYVRHVCVYKPLSGCATPTATPSMSKSGTPSFSPSTSVSPTATGSPTGTPSVTTTPTVTMTPTPTASPSSTATPTATTSTTPSPVFESNTAIYSTDGTSSSLVPETSMQNSSSIVLTDTSGDHWFLIIMGIILAAGLVTLVGMAGAGYGFYRYRRRATFIYPEDYIEDEEFPM